MTSRVLFACLQNAGRSQMAAALFNRIADPRRAVAISAGTRPAAHVHPEVRASLLEVGIDLGDVAPQLLTAAVAASVSWLVTMGCGESCPVVAGVRRLDWSIADPGGRPAAEVRRIRDEIRERVTELVRAEGWGGSES